MNIKAKYLYGLIPLGEKTSFDINSIDSTSKVYSIVYKKISAVVSDVETKIFIPTKQNVITHNTIISDIMKDYSIIPAKFGTVFSSIVDVEIFLEKFYSAAIEIFNNINNKVEFGLKVFWNEESFAELINTKEVRKLHNKINATGVKDNSYLKMQLGMLVKDIVDQNRAYYLKEIHEKITKLCAMDKINEILDAKMVFNTAYLVKKEQIEEFSKQIETLIQQYANLLEFTFSGPWPPYNFTALKIIFKTNETE